MSLQRGIRTFVNTVLTRVNLPYLEEMLDFCERMGVVLNVQPAIFGQVDYYDVTARHLALTKEQIETAFNKLSRWKREGRRLMFMPSTYQKVADWHDHNVITVSGNGVSSCMAGKYYVNIEPNGDVIPCTQNGASLTPKNILRDGLEEALRHVQRHDCSDCFMVYLNERKAVFGLKPTAPLEVLRRR